MCEAQKEVIEAFFIDQRDQLSSLAGEKGIKVTDLMTFFQKAEHIVGHELDPLLDYIVNKADLHKTKYLYTYDELCAHAFQWGIHMTKEELGDDHFDGMNLLEDEMTSVLHPFKHGENHEHLPLGEIAGEDTQNPEIAQEKRELQMKSLQIL